MGSCPATDIDPIFFEKSRMHTFTFFSSNWKMLKNFLVFFFLPAILVDEKMPHEAGYDSFLSGFGK